MEQIATRFSLPWGRLAILLFALSLPRSASHREAQVPGTPGSPDGAMHTFTAEQQSLLDALAARGVGQNRPTRHLEADRSSREPGTPLQQTITGWLRFGADEGSQQTQSGARSRAGGKSSQHPYGNESVEALRAALPLGISEKEISLLLHEVIPVTP